MPATVPPLVYRMDELPHVVGLSRATIYRLVKRGAFPKPVGLTGTAVGWRATDLQEWLTALPQQEKPA